MSDIVGETVFGSENIKILKMVTSNFRENREIIHLDYYEDEFVRLGVHEFSSIKIRITDPSGQTLQTSGKHATRIQLQFKMS